MQHIIETLLTRATTMFQTYLHRRSTRKVMVPQSRKSPNLGNFETPTWESQDKKPFGCGPRGEAQSILIQKL